MAALGVDRLVIAVRGKSRNEVSDEFGGLRRDGHRRDPQV